MRQKKYSEAIEIFDWGIEAFNKAKGPATGDENEPGLNRTAETIWYNKGIALRIQKKYDEALTAYDKAIEFDPQNLNAWNNKGIVFHEQGKYIKAIQAYDKALEINPRDHVVLTNKGWARFNRGNKIGAVKCFDRSIDIKQNYALSWKYRGVAI